VKQVACSDYLTLILLDEGEVLCVGGSNLKDKSNLPPDLNEALPVKGLEGVDVIQVSCGDYHCAALDV
jgi:alpha-tubulin suppressor-like RCC1 family protein